MPFSDNLKVWVYMHCVLFRYSFLVVLCLSNFSDASQEDHPFISRFPGAQIFSYSEFDSELISLPTDVNEGASGKPEFVTRNLTGFLTKHTYLINNISTLKVYKNYLNALQGSNTDILYQCNPSDCNSIVVEEIKRHFIGAFFNAFEESRPYVIFARQEVAEEKYLVCILFRF